MCIVVMGAFIFMQGQWADDDVYDLTRDLAVYQTNRTFCQANLTEQVQKMELTEIPAACIAKVLADKGAEEAQNMIKGFSYLAIYMFLSDVGSLISEKFLKEQANTPLYVQKVATELSGFPVSVLMSVLLPFFQLSLIAATDSKAETKIRSSMWWTGTHMEPPCKEPPWPPCRSVEENNWLFPGWGFGALLALSFNCLGSWLAGMVCKRMSCVMKLLGKVMSLGVVYFVGDCWIMKKEGRTPPLMCTLAQFIVMAGTYSFLNIKVPKPSTPEEQKPARRNPETEMAGVRAS